MFPNIAIVGEEEGTLKAPDDPPDLVFSPPTTLPFVDEALFPDELKAIDSSRICIWVCMYACTRE